jgi:hypothetical protein
MNVCMYPNAAEVLATRQTHPGLILIVATLTLLASFLATELGTLRTEADKRQQSSQATLQVSATRAFILSLKGSESQLEESPDALRRRRLIIEHQLQNLTPVERSGGLQAELMRHLRRIAEAERAISVEPR